MKKRFMFIALYLSSMLSYAQSITADNVTTTNTVTLTAEQQLAILFSKLNLTEVKTGLLEERGFCLLDPGYFAGDGVPYVKPTAAAVNNWKIQYQNAYSSALNVSNRVVGLKSKLQELNALVMGYYVPNITKTDPAPDGMRLMYSQTYAYQTLDSVSARLSLSDALCKQNTAKYLSVTASLVKSYIKSYSPQSLETMLTDDNAANILALRMLYAGMYSSSTDTLNRPLAPPALYDAEVQNMSSAIIGISMMHLNYYTLLETAMDENLLTYSNGFFRDVAGRTKSPYVRTNMVAAAPFRSVCHQYRKNAAVGRDRFCRWSRLYKGAGGCAG
jgi:hypothetical protein